MCKEVESRHLGQAAWYSSRRRLKRSNTARKVFFLSGFFVAGIASTTLMAQGTPEYVRKYEKDGLPTARAGLRLDARGIPIPIDGQASDGAVSVKALPTTDQETSALKAALRVATESPKLQSALGANSRLLAGGQLPMALDGSSSEEPRYSFTYYNYQKERAIDAQVQKGQVVEVKERAQGYQPPASTEELLAAADLLGPKFTQSINPQSLRGLAYSGPDGRRRVFLYGTTAERSTSATVEMSSKRVFQLQSVERATK